jgi:hypothetical protein
VPTQCEDETVGSRLDKRRCRKGKAVFYFFGPCGTKAMKQADFSF